MLDMPELWEYIKPHRPIVLTGIPSAIPEAQQQKRDWVRRYLGSDVEVRCCPAAEKYKHASCDAILIDDYEGYKHLWIGNGGKWVTHRSAAETIQILRSMNIQPTLAK